MIADKHPENEKRIDTLRAYCILDTESEADFDDIVSLASEICEAPVSLISLVDQGRQWFKSRIGFEPSETDLAQSVCSHAILEDKILEIKDMSTDIRTADNVLHTDGPKVQFYAGVNLVAPNGLPIGTLCILDTKPRELTAFQRQAMQTLANQVIAQLELRKKVRLLESLRDETDHRVKNSLQTISSILRLSAKRVQDPEALEILSLLERRLDAVASLHSELIGHDGAGSVDAKAYLERVILLLSDASPDNIRFKVESADITIDAKKASALGMIVSEFTANSIKHAFPDHNGGLIKVSLTRHGAEEALLYCHDDGVGTEVSGSQKLHNTGFGEKIMASAAVQLGGKIIQNSDAKGTSISLSFKF